VQWLLNHPVLPAESIQAVVRHLDILR
jgi:hypothetical protein